MFFCYDNRMTRRQKLTLLATIIGSGVAFLDGTVVTLALPNISHDLQVGFNGLQWVVDGYALTLASLILIGGSFGDIFGRKKIYMIGLAGFGLASLLCSLAPNGLALILFRMLQGVSAALLIPGGLAIINTNFPREKRGRVIGHWAAWSGVFAALGPLLGGYLIDVGSWRWIFWINIPLIAICLGLAAAGINETRDDQPRRVDVVGASLAAGSLSAITYGLIEGPANHWQAWIIALLGIGAALALIFVWFESKTKDPIIPLRLFDSRNFSGSNLMTLAMYGALSGFMFALVIYMQTKIGYSPIKAGVVLMPITILLLLFSGRMGGLAARHGARWFMTIGPLVCSLAMFSLLGYKPGDSYVSFLLPRVVLFGIGLVTFVAPLTATVMSSVDERSSGIASGINNAVSRTGGLVVIALLGLLGAQHFYRFSMTLCAVLAAAAGLISLLLIHNPKIKLIKN